MIDKILLFVTVWFPVLVIPLLISLIDFVTLARAKRRRVTKHTPDTFPEENFSILIPIFGDMKYLKNVEYLKDYAAKVILCTTMHETKAFNRDISRIAKRHGLHVFRSHVLVTTKRGKPNPWKLFIKTLEGKMEQTALSNTARDEIIRDSFSVVDTPYCVFLDGDTVSQEPLQKLVGHFRDMDFDLSSVRVLASHKDTLCEKLQSIEYELSMDARKIYPWLTSGACMVAKTPVIRDIMQHHSLFFSGGDIEIGKLGKILKYKVGHIPFELFTDVPVTFKAWFKQRMAWCGGGFRHAIINAHRYSWRHPMFYLYTTVVVYLMTPLRWYELVRHPLVIPLVIALYWTLVFAFHWKYRQWYFFAFPIYALVQVMIIVPLGVCTYIKMATHGKSLGHIKLRGTALDVTPTS